MGRSPKIGLDYFRLDVHLDDKFKMIEAEFGLKGFAVVVKLYQKIYGEQGYYCEWNDDVALVFGKDIGLQPGANAVSEIVTASIKRRLFDKGMFEKYHILTSNGIQERYFEAVERRERVEVIQEYLLVSCDKLPKNVNIKRISVDRKSVSDGRNAHSRVDKIKEVVEEEKGQTGICGDQEFAKFVHAYQSDIGLLPTSTTARGDLETFYDEFGLEAICEIIRYTARKNPDSPKNYFTTLCRALLGKGIRTTEQVQAAFKDYERRKSRGSRQGREARHEVSDSDYAKPEDFY